MNKRIESITLNANGTVTIIITCCRNPHLRKPHYGPHKKQQITFPRREFEKALNDAWITVPWDVKASL